MTRRLLLSYLTLTVLVLAMLEIPLGISYAQRQREDLTVDVERDAVAMASFAEDTLEGTERQDLQQLADNYDERTGGRVVIVDDAGDAMADSDPLGSGQANFSSRPEVERALTGQVATGTRHSDDLDQTLLYVAVPIASGGRIHGALRITYPTSTIDERVRANWLRLGGVALATLVAATIIGVALARSVSRPLRNLEEAATRFGEGRLDARSPTAHGPPEVRRLARAFNQTAARLQELLVAQEAFVADASHQLRTPLAALRLRLENLAGESPTEAAEDVQAALQETARLSRLVDGLLALARADRVSGLSTAVPTDLSRLVTQRIDAWRPVAEEQGVRLRAPGPDAAAAVLVTPEHLEGALDNLLANAIDASAEGDTVSTTVVDAGDEVELRLSDQGPGLSAEQRAHAFDRFWRGAPGEGRLGGSGLGLSIAQKLVHADGGTLVLRDGPDATGLTALIRLPKPQ